MPSITWRNLIPSNSVLVSATRPMGPHTDIDKSEYCRLASTPIIPFRKNNCFLANPKNPPAESLIPISTEKIYIRHWRCSRPKGNNGGISSRKANNSKDFINQKNPSIPLLKRKNSNTMIISPSPKVPRKMSSTSPRRKTLITSLKVWLKNNNNNKRKSSSATIQRNKFAGQLIYSTRSNWSMKSSKYKRKKEPSLTSSNVKSPKSSLIGKIPKS